MTNRGARYRKGYSIGVGGVVLCGDRALLIQRASGRNTGDWMIPGGFIEIHETIDVAVRREVKEETGIDAEIEGLIGVRNQVYEKENSAYFIFLMRASDDRIEKDELEVAGARFYSMGEVEALVQLQALSREVVIQALRGEASLLELFVHPRHSFTKWVSYI
jgi:ADP-ribose pyrophosphatase YjhB (NUDIX family)